MPITQHEARAIADALEKTAEVVQKYLEDHGEGMTDEDRNRLYGLLQDLVFAGTEAVTRAVGLTIEDMEEQGTLLSNEIKHATDALKQIQAVGEVIDWVAKIADLAGAIAGKSPAGIVAAAKALKPS